MWNRRKDIPGRSSYIKKALARWDGRSTGPRMGAAVSFTLNSLAVFSKYLTETQCKVFLGSNVTWWATCFRRVLHEPLRWPGLSSDDTSLGGSKWGWIRGRPGEVGGERWSTEQKEDLQGWTRWGGGRSRWVLDSEIQMVLLLTEVGHLKLHVMMTSRKREDFLYKAGYPKTSACALCANEVPLRRCTFGFWTECLCPPKSHVEAPILIWWYLVVGPLGGN